MWDNSSGGDEYHGEKKSSAFICGRRLKTVSMAGINKREKQRSLRMTLKRLVSRCGCTPSKEVTNVTYPPLMSMKMIQTWILPTKMPDAVSKWNVPRRHFFWKGWEQTWWSGDRTRSKRRRSIYNLQETIITWDNPEKSDRKVRMTKSVWKRSD